MAFSEVNVPVNTAYNDKGMKESIKDLNKLGKTVDKVAARAFKAAANFAFLQGGRALFEFGADSVQNARDLQRNLNGLQAVFGELTPQMIEFTENASDLGLSQSRAAQATTFLGSVLKQSGFSLEGTAELTQQLVALGTDLAIVYGYDVQEALLGMTALFRGEYDPIEKFGVAMKQSEIDTEKARLGLEGLTGSHERYVDQLIRVTFLMDRAKDSQGQFQEQSNTLFAQQKILNAEFENMKARIGEDLLPIFANLASLIRSEVLPVLGPALQDVFGRFVTLIRSLIENKDELIPKILRVVEAIVIMTKIFVNLTIFVTENIRMIAAFGGALITFYGITKGLALVSTLYAGVKASIDLATGAQRRFNIVSRRSVAGLLASLAAVGVGAAVFKNFDSGLEETTEGLVDFEKANEDALAELDKVGRAGLEAYSDELVQSELQKYVDGTVDLGEAIDGVGEAAGGAATQVDGLANFYAKLTDEARKQSARVQLETLGATEGLIEAILGSGDQWQRVFNDVVSRGVDSVREVQNLFGQTKAGFDEAMAEYEREVLEPFKRFKEAALQAKDAMLEFVDSIEILPSVERELGRFERAAADKLTRIEEDLEDAFDNEYLLEENYKNLLNYARDEFAVLQRIERQRDDILRRRDAAMAMIDSVQQSVRSSADLVNILQDVQNETERVDMTKIVKDTIAEAQGLREFEVIVTSAVVEPIEEVVSKSEQLVQGYRGIVDRTRAFVKDMKALRDLGLDPALFNELVEAGVDAGGETARALIDGGQDTVNEVNNLFGELNALGEELGEETAQVMYGQGEMFVDGIVQGLEDQATQLEEQAIALAAAFTESFEQLLISGIEIAIAKAELALSMMPTFEGMPILETGAGSGGGGNGGGGGGAGEDDGFRLTGDIPGFATPETVQSLVDKRRQEVEDIRRQATLAAERAAASLQAQARRAAQSDKISSSKSSGVGIGGERPTNYTVINTGQSTRAVEVAISRANAVRGAGTTNNIRRLADRGIA